MAEVLAAVLLQSWQPCGQGPGSCMAKVLAAILPRSWQLCYQGPGSHMAEVLAAILLRSWQLCYQGPGSCVTKVLAAALPWQPCCWAPCCSVLGDGDVSFPPQCSPASCWLFLPPVSSTACASPRGTFKVGAPHCFALRVPSARRLQLSSPLPPPTASSSPWWAFITSTRSPPRCTNPRRPPPSPPKPSAKAGRGIDGGAGAAPGLQIAQ